jgi:hypothetical protein
MALSTDVQWKNLEAQGFVHIPAFLSPSQLAVCTEDYLSQPVADNRNYALSNVTQRVVDCVRGSLREVIDLVQASTDIKVDLYLGASYFATKRGISFDWHQDHESYYLTQNHYDYLNFYIALVKPRKDKSNLSIVPFDVLQRESPRTFPHVYRSGASTSFSVGGRQVLMHDDSGAVHAADTTFDRIAVTPQLEAGDLLLLRGDILHKTQDEETSRVALSIRLGFSKTIVRRSTLADGGRAKTRMMARNLSSYQRVFEAFDAAGRDELPLVTLISMMNDRLKTQGPLEPVNRPGRYLLKQKVRSRVLLSSARKAAGEIVWNPLIKYYYRRQGTPAPRVAQAAPRQI